MKLIGLLLAVACTSAGAVNTGNWVGTSNADQIATGVPSDSGALFGMTCTKSTGTCEWGISIDLGCQPGASYPFLMSARSGGYHVTGVCVGQSSDPRLHRYNITGSMDVIREALSSGGTIGFVTPTEAGKFKVFRFDVDHADTAITALLNAFQIMTSNKGRDGDL